MPTADERLARGLDLRAQAVREQNRGHPARARQYLLAAGRTLGAVPESPEHRAAQARIAITMALVDFELLGAEAGLRSAEDARELAKRTGDATLIVPAAGQVGLIWMRMGELRRAVEAFEAVGSLLPAAEPSDRFAVLLNHGVAGLLIGELAVGRRVLREALAVARASNHPLGEFKAGHNLGYLEFLRGDLPAALARMEEALERNPGMSLGVPLLDRARVLVEAGLVREADEVLARASVILARDRLSQDLAEVELERARCGLIAADVASARVFAGRARRRFARRGSDRWRQNAELVLLQADLAAGRPGNRLIGPARRLRDELAAEGLSALARTAALVAVEAALAASDLAQAVQEIERLGRESKRDAISYRLHATYVRARLDMISGQRSSAASRLRRGLQELAKYQAGFGSIDLSTAAAVHGRRLVELDNELAIASGKAPAIFAAAERGRAVTSRLAPVRPPDDPVTAELLAELRQTVESLRGVELDASRSAPLLRRRRDLEAQIAQRAWSRRGSSAVAATVAYDEVRAALTAHTMATFVVSGGSVGALVLDNSRAQFVSLAARADVVEQVRRLRADLDVLAQPGLPAPMAGAVRASCDRSLDALDEMLVRPLAFDRRAVLVTTGLLGQIPWGALPSLCGVPVEVAPSATAWLTARQVGKRSGGRRLVSLAGPGLARSSEEATEVARAWGLTMSVSGKAATGAALHKAMSGARVVHVAAHGTHQSENPLFSSIRLADGPLFAHELDQTVGTPEHVVLSACELGLATVRPGDEALGLTSVLLRLGTRSVVAGVARISDDIAAATMASYHGLLAKGVDSAAALAQAGEASGVPLPLVNFGASWSHAAT